jgi:hypothetical protein
MNFLCLKFMPISEKCSQMKYVYRYLGRSQNEMKMLSAYFIYV